MLAEFRERFARDAELDEILVNGTSGMALVRKREVLYERSPFASREDMAVWAQDMAQDMDERLDPLCPSAGGMLDDQFRWHAVLPPMAADGPLFALRRHRFGTLTLDHFDGCDKTSLSRAMSQGAAILIAGPTGAGKTSFLAALLAHHARAERVVVAESLRELPALSPAWIRLAERRASVEGTGAVPLTALIHEAMRLRPDRLVVGEIRGHEASAFLEALTTGHRGVMATIHAGSPEQACARLAALAQKELERDRAAPGRDAARLRAVGAR